MKTSHTSQKLRIYCETNAITPQIRDLKKKSKIIILHFPYDPGSKSRRTSETALPSGAQLRDLGCTIEEVGEFRYCDFECSEHFDSILKIVGKENRRDALHVDSAFKSNCICIVTNDSDIWSKAFELEPLLGLRVFQKGDPELVAFLEVKVDG